MKKDKIRSIIIIEDNNIEQKAKDLGAYVYFTKPFNNSIFVNTLNKALVKGS
jgi:DNA-binding NtrC family response regulator